MGAGGVGEIRRFHYEAVLLHILMKNVINNNDHCEGRSNTRLGCQESFKQIISFAIIKKQLIFCLVLYSVCILTAITLALRLHNIGTSIFDTFFIYVNIILLSRSYSTIT